MVRRPCLMVDTKAPIPDSDQPEPPAGQPGRAPSSTKNEGGRPRAAAQSMADLLVGTLVAERYELIDKLGEGAMGWVFLGEHVDIGKKVAVKVLRPSLCRMPEAVRRFRREARAATQIGSKHIIDVTDFGTTQGGAVFFVMEYLEGGEDLGTTLKKARRLPWQRVRHIVLQLCEALQAAHDAGIIHRDVKPANFYRVHLGGDDDFIKVLDFGIARLATPKDSIVTATGVVMGTPDFMAPEQAQDRHVDHRADIYSLGATAYALLTGRPPFTGANEYDVIYKQLNEDARPPSDLALDAEIPPWMDKAVLKALRKEPERRYQSMGEFAAALRAEGAKGASGPTAPPPSKRKKPVKPSKGPGLPVSLPVIVLATLMLMGVGALIFYVFFT